MHGFQDDSREIKVTAMDTLGNVLMFFKDTMEPLLPRVID